MISQTPAIAKMLRKALKVVIKPGGKFIYELNSESSSIQYQVKTENSSHINDWQQATTTDLAFWSTGELPQSLVGIRCVEKGQILATFTRTRPEKEEISVDWAMEVIPQSELTEQVAA